MIETVVLLPISTNINVVIVAVIKVKKKEIRRDGSLIHTNMFKNLNLLPACMRVCMLIYMYISLCIKVHRHRTNFQSVSATPRQIFLLLYPSCRKQRENNDVPCSFTLLTFMNTRWHISLSNYTHSRSLCM